jgi:predicted nucleic acid-binding Zn finger protein
VPSNEPSLDQLRNLVFRSSRENPHLTSWLEKAAFLMLMRPIRALGEDHYQVGSEDGLRHYEVLNGHCECSDYLRHGAGHPCKHRLALAFHQQLNDAEKRINPNGGELSDIGTNHITA